MLICPANVQLNLSGGVGGEALLRGGESIQRELHAALARAGKRYVDPGSIIVRSAGTLDFRAIVHAVATDAFYRTMRALLARKKIASALDAAAAHSAVAAMPALATASGARRWPTSRWRCATLSRSSSRRLPAASRAAHRSGLRAGPNSAGVSAPIPASEEDRRDAQPQRGAE